MDLCCSLHQRKTQFQCLIHCPQRHLVVILVLISYINAPNKLQKIYHIFYIFTKCIQHIHWGAKVWYHIENSGLNWSILKFWFITTVKEITWHDSPQTNVTSPGMVSNVAVWLTKRYQTVFPQYGDFIRVVVCDVRLQVCVWRRRPAANGVRHKRSRVAQLHCEERSHYTWS